MFYQFGLGRVRRHDLLRRGHTFTRPAADVVWWCLGRGSSSRLSAAGCVLLSGWATCAAPAVSGSIVRAAVRRSADCSHTQLIPAQPRPSHQGNCGPAGSVSLSPARDPLPPLHRSLHTTQYRSGGKLAVPNSDAAHNNNPPSNLPL